MERRLGLMMLRSMLLISALASVRCIDAQKQQDKQPDPPLDGAALTKQKGCVYCHGENLEGRENKAPSLRGVALRRDKTFMEGQIRNGGQSMPPFGEALTNEEIQALVQYLSQMKEAPLKPGGEPRQRSVKKR